MPDSPDEPPRRLVFGALEDDTTRRPLLAFLATITAAGLALVWPVYPLVGGIRPFIFGLPLSFAWVVLWLCVVFVALVMYFRWDESEPAD